MKQNSFGLKLNVEGIGYIDTRHEASLHAVKSTAGSLFQKDVVNSVCVYDASGTARLYLKKTDDGVVREEN